MEFRQKINFFWMKIISVHAKIDTLSWKCAVKEIIQINDDEELEREKAVFLEELEFMGSLLFC